MNPTSSAVLIAILFTSFLSAASMSSSKLLLPANAASTLIVPTNFQTIQSAIDSASPGDTIQILPGTYTEQITINKSLKIVGSGMDSTTIKTPGTLAKNSFDRKVSIEINNGAVVDMSRVTIAGPGTGVCNSPNWGVAVLGGATLDLSSSSVVHFRTKPTGNCNQFATAILVGLPPSTFGGQVGHAVISNVKVSDYQTHGISITDEGSTATVSHSTIIGIGPTKVSVQNGILVGFGASATLEHNTISDNLCDVHGCGPDPINQGQSQAIFTNEAGTGTEISNNNAFNNDVGIYLFSSEDCCTTSNNEMTNNRFFGLIIQDGSNTASHNEITGGRVGIGVVADSVDTTGTLDNNQISQTTVKDIQEISCCGFVATALTGGN